MKIKRLSEFMMATSVLALSACGGGSGGGSGSSLSEPEQFGLLRPASSNAEMATSLRQGMADSGVASKSEKIFALDNAIAGAPTGSEADVFSTTNLQEVGVDEADTVKYDGEILYVLDRSTAYHTEPNISEFARISFAPEDVPAEIKLLRTVPSTPATEEVATIQFNSGNLNGGLYLFEDETDRRLISVGHDNNLYNWALFAIDAYWREQSTHIAAWNVSEPTSPAEDWTLQIDGSLLTSRRIDNILYLVTRYTPHLEGLLPYPVTEEEVSANQALIEEASLADLLPNLVRNGGEPGELLEGTDCYLPNPEFEGLRLPPASGSLITVTAINLQTPEQVESICFNSFASGFYASRSSLYITTYGSDDSTLIHKIRLANGKPEYRGSGQVPGYLGTRNPGFLMSEEGADLRVVSSSWEDRFFPMPVIELEEPLRDEPVDVEEEAVPQQDFGRHRLTILRESGDGTRLDQIAQLPNAERPGRIGKAGEDLYAARFLGNRAYLVTFEVIDPLYVLDLSEPQDPRVTGELELPGFSTLLQPLGEELLLGVGSEVPDDGLAITQGVKISLFNVADIENPVELSSETFGKRGSFSPALDDHHALTLLDMGDHYRATIPIQRHALLREGDDGTDPWTWYDWSDSGLYEFEISPATGSLEHVGTFPIESRSEEHTWPQYPLQDSRSVLHGDAVFLVQPPRVWSSFWGE